MERQLFMHEPHWKALTEKHVIDYCAFRHPLMKTENIWVSEFGWQPTGITGDGRCHGKCESGSVHDATGRYTRSASLQLRFSFATNPYAKLKQAAFVSTDLSGTSPVCSCMHEMPCSF